MLVFHNEKFIDILGNAVFNIHKGIRSGPEIYNMKETKL